MVTVGILCPKVVLYDSFINCTSLLFDVEFDDDDDVKNCISADTKPDILYVLADIFIVP